MAMLLKVVKPNNVASWNSLKLSFANSRGLHSNSFSCEFFLESSSFNILALSKTNLKEPINSNNISVRSYLSLFRKDSVIHMHDMAVYTNEGRLFVLGLSLEYSDDSYSCIRLTLFHLMYCFTFLYQSPPSSLCTVFDVVSSHIDRSLSINPSAKVFNFFY